MAIQTVREICESHTLKTLQRTNASHHAMQVARYLTDLTKRHGNVFVHEFKSEMVQQWLDEHNWSPCTKSNALKAVRAAFRETEWSCDVSIGIPQRRQRRNLISSKTHRRLVDAADPDLANVLDALYFTGARTSELINLDIKHVVDRPEGMFWNRPVDKMGYGNPIAIPAVLAESVLGLMAERKNSAPLFTRANGNRWSYMSLRHALHKVFQKCGLEGIVFKDYRYSFYRRLLVAGVCPRIITILLGYYSSWDNHHSNPTTPEDLLDAVNRAAEVERDDV